MSNVRHEGRAAAAKKRQAERDARSPAEQLALLDQRLGAGLGAKRERGMLAAKVAAASKAPASKVEVKVP
jgi:hypothetical protein